VTEPREPEPTLDDGEATRPIEALKTEPAGWYPVDARPVDADGTAEAVEAEPGPVVEPEATVEPEAVVEPEPAEPSAGIEPEAHAEPEPVAEQPAAVEAEPVAEPVGETVAIPADEETRPLFGVPEPTVATGEPDVPAEETVALEPAAVGAEPTAVINQTAPAQPYPLQAAPAPAIFRQPSPSPEFEPTRMEQLTDEEQKLAAERAARRDARTTALAASAPVPLVAPEPVIVHKRTNDKFWGSVGLFLLRLVLAAILAIRGLNLLTDIPAAQASFAKTIIPYPEIMAIVTGVAALLIALSLVLGLLTRLAGLGIALIGGGALAFVYWGNWSPFIAGRPGFLGDYELLLAAVGVLLLCIGAGGWSLDRSVRAGRERNKAERASEGE
jgi:uncharacterized membrane protein YphA (DoxX/SURF4 family)